MEAVRKGLQKKCLCAVPTGLQSAFVETAFPTLKRGAYKRCAYGAAVSALLMQESIKPSAFCRAYVRANARTLHPSDYASV